MDEKMIISAELEKEIITLCRKFGFGIEKMFAVKMVLGNDDLMPVHRDEFESVENCLRHDIYHLDSIHEKTEEHLQKQINDINIIISAIKDDLWGNKPE